MRICRTPYCRNDKGIYIQQRCNVFQIIKESEPLNRMNMKLLDVFRKREVEPETPAPPREESASDVLLKAMLIRFCAELVSKAVASDICLFT
mgnify:CR=1 FL=1